MYHATGGEQTAEDGVQRLLLGGLSPVHLDTLGFPLDNVDQVVVLERSLAEQHDNVIMCNGQANALYSDHEESPSRLVPCRNSGLGVQPTSCGRTKSCARQGAAESDTD